MADVQLLLYHEIMKMAMHRWSCVSNTSHIYCEQETSHISLHFKLKEFDFPFIGHMRYIYIYNDRIIINISCVNRFDQDNIIFLDDPELFDRLSESLGNK